MPVETTAPSAAAMRTQIAPRAHSPLPEGMAALPFHLAWPALRHAQCCDGLPLIRSTKSVTYCVRGNLWGPRIFFVDLDALPQRSIAIVFKGETQDQLQSVARIEHSEIRATCWEESVCLLEDA